MKITTTNFFTFTKAKDASRSRSASNHDQRVSKNFDEISISRSSVNPEEAFAKDLASKLSTEVRTPTSTRTLEELRSQIENNTYQPDLDEVVKRLMMSSESV